MFIDVKRCENVSCYMQDFNGIESSDNKYLTDVAGYITHLHLMVVFLDNQLFFTTGASPSGLHFGVYLSSTSSNVIYDDDAILAIKALKKANRTSVDLSHPWAGTLENLLMWAQNQKNDDKEGIELPFMWERQLYRLEVDVSDDTTQGNLVRGLPSKLFENDQTCVACQKGKQHRASCKSKTENSISLPLHLLHMDLFGPTFVKSLMKKMYCLVVTDDYSRFTWVFFLATKDETSGILKSFITGIENLVDHKVKAEAVNTACYVQNRVLVVKPHNKTPYELFHGRSPTLSFMRPFECPVTILNTIDYLSKFDGKADKGFFVGYSLNSKAFRVFNSRTRIVEENLHIRFSESTPNVVGSGLNWLFDIDALTRIMNYEPIVAGTQSNDFADTKASDNAGQARKETEPVKNYILLPLWPADPPFSHDPKSSHNDGFKPSSDDGKKVDEDPIKDSECNDQEKEDNVNSTNYVNAASTNEDYVGGKTSIELPFDPNMPALEDYNIFDSSRNDEDDGRPKKTLVDLPYGKRAIGTKWVFRNKKDEMGIVIRNKARLVAQGYTQEEGIDYDDVFAHIKEEVYVCQPPGFEDPDFPDRVYKVKKALYGLHQAPRAWYKGDILLVQVYVDDIIFGSTKKELCNAFEKLMHEKFQMSSMGELTFFLGLQVQQKKDGIFISQDKYVDEILKKFRFTEVKTASTPIETQKPLLKDENGEEVDVHMYRSMIGSLMYLTSSRPDIMFVVCACARYQVNPKVSHLHAVKRIFRYLKGQLKLGLWYPKDSPFDLVAYTDSDYAGASLDRKSTTRGCQFLGCRLISWQCKKQTVVANSTTEAEYVAASSCCRQVLWIQNQLLDYGYNFMHTKIFIDNNRKAKKSVRLMMEELCKNRQSDLVRKRIKKVSENKNKKRAV
ncbi:putative ribonuclease H-like domain-containing protein [Tanacetum coccineum]